MSEFTAFFSDIDSIAGRTPNVNAHLAVKVSIVGNLISAFVPCRLFAQAAAKSAPPTGSPT